MIQTLITESTHFTHILHVADIHIRLTKRHDEYREVFDKLYEEVKNSPPATLVCVLGDVVHTKLDLSPECVQLVKDFLFSLAEIRPTVVVAGNHDTNLSNRGRLDCLTPIVNAINHPNMYFLPKSGLFAFGNVCINNYSVFDDPSKYIKGIDIPKSLRNTYKYFVVLYHGVVDNSMTDIGFRIINKSTTTALFDNHDIALLGDIHLRQDLQAYDFDTDKPAIHYCGSLIQQNHGESLLNHGFSLWDLKTRTYVATDIPNDFGYFTVLLSNGQIDSDIEMLPKKVRLQFKLVDTVATEVKAALSKIRGLTEVVETSYNKVADDSKPKSIIPSGVVLGNITNLDYQTNLITDYLKNRLQIVDKAIVDEIIKINTTTNTNIKKDDFARNIRWIPIRFEWDNMFSYGEGNVIDFTKTKNIVGLFAANASGKSAILSALSYCIFDKCEREFKAANILNIQKTTFRCKLEFEIDNQRYYIERKGEADRKGVVKVKVKFWKIENGKEVELQGEDRTDTNSVIREYLGTYEDFILTTLSVQSGKNNVSVIDMGHTDRKDLLSQFIGLSIFDRLYSEANERFKELNSSLKIYQKDDYTKLLLDITNAITQHESLFVDENKKQTEALAYRDEWQKKLVEETKNLIKIDVAVPPVETSQKNKDVAIGKIALVKNEIEPTTKQITDLSSENEILEKIVKEHEDKETTKHYFRHEELIKKKVDLQNKWDRLVLSVGHEKTTIEKTKEHQYDPNCKFCVSNGAKFIKDREEATAKLDKYKEVAIGIKTELDAVQTEIAGLSWTFEATKIHQTSLAKLNANKTLQIRATSRLSVIQKTITDLETEIKSCDDNIALYNKNKDDLLKNEIVNKQIQGIKHEISQAEGIIKINNRAILELNGKIAGFKNQVDTINKKMTEAKEIETEHKLYEIYTQLVCRDGIPFNVIASTVPEIENEVNTILSQISEFSAKFETDGKNIIPYIVYDDKKWLMSLTSGMERFTLSLAIRVALINISNLPKPNFLIIDEGFSVLDSENISAMSILFSYLKSQFEFVIIISHNEILRDMVDNQLEVKKENGFSKVIYI